MCGPNNTRTVQLLKCHQPAPHRQLKDRRSGENPQDLLKQNVHVTQCSQQINRRLSQPLESARLCYRRQWAQSLASKCNRSNSITPFTVSIAFHVNELLYTFPLIQWHCFGARPMIFEKMQSKMNQMGTGKHRHNHNPV